MRVLKVKVISLPYIFKVLYVLCFTRPRYQVSVYRTIGPLVIDCCNDDDDDDDNDDCGGSSDESGNSDDDNDGHSGDDRKCP